MRAIRFGTHSCRPVRSAYANYHQHPVRQCSAIGSRHSISLLATHSAISNFAPPYIRREAGRVLHVRTSRPSNRYRRARATNPPPTPTPHFASPATQIHTRTCVSRVPPRLHSIIINWLRTVVYSLVGSDAPSRPSCRARYRQPDRAGPLGGEGGSGTPIGPYGPLAPAHRNCAPHICICQHRIIIVIIISGGGGGSSQRWHAGAHACIINIRWRQRPHVNRHVIQDVCCERCDGRGCGQMGAHMQIGVRACVRRRPAGRPTDRPIGPPMITRVWIINVDRIAPRMWSRVTDWVYDIVYLWETGWWQVVAGGPTGGICRTVCTTRTYITFCQPPP